MIKLLPLLISSLFLGHVVVGRTGTAAGKERKGCGQNPQSLHYFEPPGFSVSS